MREANRLRAEAGPSSRVLIAGESNPYGGPDSNALVCWPSNSAGHRLQSKILGIPEELYLSIHRRNLCRGHWSIMLARNAAASMLRNEHAWDVIIMLGRKVTEAFDPNIIPFATATRWGWVNPDDDVLCVDAQYIGRKKITLVSIPHPSGRNASSWAGNAIDRTRDLLREVAPGIAWGSWAG